MKHVVVIERIRHCRSCFIYCLRPTRYLWWAKFKLRVQLAIAEEDCNYWIANEVEADKLCSTYRNWLGDNRVGH